jgi:hypothetical protein
MTLNDSKKTPHRFLLKVCFVSLCGVVTLQRTQAPIFLSMEQRSTSHRRITRR